MEADRDYRLSRLDLCISTPGEVSVIHRFFCGFPFLKLEIEGFGNPFSRKHNLAKSHANYFSWVQFRCGYNEKLHKYFKF